MQAFQFPSNGKGFPNEIKFKIVETAEWVSIPFKRERLSEQVLGVAWLRNWFRFNSLQTGKAFRTRRKLTEVKFNIMFQFPSNGKGFPN